MIIKSTLLAVTFALAAAPMAYAKSHAQGINGEYRERGVKQTKENVQVNTVEQAQGLGAALGAAHGFNNLR